MPHAPGLPHARTCLKLPRSFVPKQGPAGVGSGILLGLKGSLGPRIATRLIKRSGALRTTSRNAAVNNPKKETSATPLALSLLMEVPLKGCPECEFARAIALSLLDAGVQLPHFPLAAASDQVQWCPRHKTPQDLPELRVEKCQAAGGYHSSDNQGPLHSQMFTLNKGPTSTGMVLNLALQCLQHAKV